MLNVNTQEILEYLNSKQQQWRQNMLQMLGVSLPLASTCCFAATGWRLRRENHRRTLLLAHLSRRARRPRSFLARHAADSSSLCLACVAINCRTSDN